MIDQLSDDLHSEEVFDSFLLIIALVILFTLKVWAYYQKEKIHFYYKKGESVVHEFLMKTEVRELVYIPSIVTLNAHW